MTAAAPVRIPEALVPLLRDITTVSQHPRNPNNGDVDAIVESIQMVGYTAPIIVQASTGYIVAGNHRYAAMLALGQDAIPVVEVDWDDERTLRHLLGDNRTAELGRRDEAALLELLKELTDSDYGLAGTAYEPDDIARLAASIEPNPGMFAAASASMVYGVMVTCEDAATSERVLSILEGEPGVRARGIVL